MSASVDTIVAPATPSGTAALAMVRASGPDCRNLAQQLFGAPALEPRQATHRDYRDVRGGLIDDVVVTLFAAPRSATGEDLLEFTAHGNPLIVQKLVADLLARGCRMAEPGEFTRRAFLNGRVDLSQAEAVMDVIHARSEQALHAAQQQLRGSLGRHLAQLVDRLLGAIARIEAYIDFPEEDLPPEDQTLVREELQHVLRGTERLLATRRYGDLLRQGIRTVLVGEPNVGKSSLLNALVGRDRALVSPEPGTTRDYLEESLLVGKHAIRLIDTAGLNPRPGTVEQLGIQKTLEQVRDADLVLLVEDATHPPPGLPPEVQANLPEDRTLVVVNKIDAAPDAATRPRPALTFPTLATSAITGAGMAELVAQIEQLADRLNPAQSDEVIAINARHADALARAAVALREADSQLAGAAPVELLASNLRAALDALGEIGGRIDHERVLDKLFAEFCIGK